ncbi:hypothetical protein G6F65_022730 [Rhizopus arrhizus]|jgi:hypothetical protein|nr:hypothetical protein G6F65_022730 [Rhizopus arrhizus]
MPSAVRNDIETFSASAALEAPAIASAATSIEIFFMKCLLESCTRSADARPGANGANLALGANDNSTGAAWWASNLHS